MLAGLASLLLLGAGRTWRCGVTAALAVAGLLWGWGAGQYPELLPGVDLSEAAATDSVLAASLGALGVGALLLIPSMWWLYATFQREDVERADADVNSG